MGVIYQWIITKVFAWRCLRLFGGILHQKVCSHFCICDKEMFAQMRQPIYNTELNHLRKKMLEKIVFDKTTV